VPNPPNAAAASRNVAPPPPPAPRGSQLHKLSNVAWLAILLGMAMEALMLAVAAGFRTAAAPDPFLAELAQKVSWSFLVCVGLALGNAIVRARPAAMGVLGLVSRAHVLALYERAAAATGEFRAAAGTRH